MRENGVADSTVHDESVGSSASFKSSRQKTPAERDADRKSSKYRSPLKPRSDGSVLVPYKADDLNPDVQLSIDISEDEDDDPFADIDRQFLEEMLDDVQNYPEDEEDSDEEPPQGEPEVNALDELFPRVSLATALKPLTGRMKRIPLAPSGRYQPKRLVVPGAEHLLALERNSNQKDSDAADFRFIYKRGETLSRGDDEEPKPKRSKRKRQKPARMRMSDEFCYSDKSEIDEDGQQQHPSTSNGVTSSSNGLRASKTTPRRSKSAFRDSPQQRTPDSSTPTVPAKPNQHVIRLKRSGDQYKVEKTLDWDQDSLAALPPKSKIGRRFPYSDGDKRYEVQQIIVPSLNGSGKTTMTHYYARAMDVDGNRLPGRLKRISERHLVEKFEAIANKRVGGASASTALKARWTRRRRCSSSFPSAARSAAASRSGTAPSASPSNSISCPSSATPTSPHTSSPSTIGGRSTPTGTFSSRGSSW